MYLVLAIVKDIEELQLPMKRHLQCLQRSQIERTDIREDRELRPFRERRVHVGGAEEAQVLVNVELFRWDLCSLKYMFVFVDVAEIRIGCWACCRCCWYCPD